MFGLACECICVGCMLPIRIDELGKNDECPKCNSNKYTIRNDNSSTGNKIKLGPLQSIIFLYGLVEELETNHPIKRKHQIHLHIF